VLQRLTTKNNGLISEKLFEVEFGENQNSPNSIRLSDARIVEIIPHIILCEGFFVITN
jgi:hypothetical protein